MLEKLERLEIQAGHIPLVVYRPEKYSTNRKTIIYYHGWSSNVANYELFAQLIATQGYQVILPEISRHGKRGEADYETFREAPDVVIETIAEFGDIKSIAIDRLNADKENLVVGGHSLGGMITSAIVTFDESINLGIIYNGLFDYNLFLENTADSGIDEDTKEVFKQFNPMDKIEKLNNRKLDIHVGLDDKVIPKDAMEYLEDKINNLEINSNEIKFNYYEDAGHGVSYTMIRNTVDRLKEDIGITEYKCCNK